MQLGLSSLVCASVLVACGTRSSGHDEPPVEDASALDARSSTVDATREATDSAAFDTSVPSDAMDSGAHEGSVAMDADASEACAPFGAPGQCMDASACAALGDHSSYPGYCPGPANIQCCIVTPNTANDPPTPAGWVLMQQADVTAAMTAWAVMLLDDPTGYPMFSETTMAFGTLLVLALVEWHPPDFQNSAVHRGVTLFEPAD